MLTPEIIIATEVKYRNVERVWRSGFQGQNEVIPVIDTGVDFAQLPAGAFAAQFDLTPDQDNHDYQGHGTLMAKYILGMVPQAKIVSVKVIGKETSTEEQGLIEALNVCAGLSPAPKFINMSMAISRSFLSFRNCTREQPCVLCARVNELFQQGIMTVAAAGNVKGRPDSLTCPANANWAVKVRSLSHQKTLTLGQRIAEALLPWAGGEADHLLGTSQAAALTTGGLSLLASAFPKRLAKEIYAVVQLTGVPIEAQAVAANPKLFQFYPDNSFAPNLYRAYVFGKQATENPQSMDFEQSKTIVLKVVELLKGACRASEVMLLLEKAAALDQSNYLAFYLYAVVAKNMGMAESAEKLLARCTELLPPGEALDRLEIFGGRPATQKK